MPSSVVCYTSISLSVLYEAVGMMTGSNVCGGGLQEVSPSHRGYSVPRVQMGVHLYHGRRFMFKRPIERRISLKMNPLFATRTIHVFILILTLGRCRVGELYGSIEND